MSGRRKAPEEEKPRSCVSYATAWGSGPSKTHHRHLLGLSYNSYNFSMSKLAKIPQIVNVWRPISKVLQSFFGNFELSYISKTFQKIMAYQCEKCSYVTKHRHHLKRHESSKHENIKFDCPHCPAELKRKDSLLRHIKSLHPVAKRKPHLNVLSVIENLKKLRGNTNFHSTFIYLLGWKQSETF